MEIADLRQSFKDLNRRFNEVEFERAERTQLRNEFRALDQKIKDNLTQVQDRLSALENQVAQLRVTPPSLSSEDIQQLKSELSEEQLVPLRKDLEQVEARLETLPREFAPGSEATVTEGLRRLEERMTQSESDIAALAELNRSQAEDSPEGMDKLSRDVDELRGSLQNVTVRYSEIGELKKNHLILLNKVESFQLQLEQAAKTQERAVSNRVPELETEVLALRAEVRQTLKKLEALEAASPAAAQDVGVLSGELAEYKKMHAEQIEQMQAAFDSTLKKELAHLPEITDQVAGSDQRQRSLETALEELRQSVSEAVRQVSDIDQAISALRSEQGKLRSDLRCSEEKLTTILARPPEEPRPPLEEDVHVIRETLDELRRFLNSTARKP
jgi:chromosome segregation ATPase